MIYFEKILEKIVKILNEIAGWTLAVCMGLITLNVVLREVFGKPILGAYEWVGILTSVTIALGLSFCAYVDAHITIDFLVEKLKPSVQRVLGVITGVISASFMALAFVSIFNYAMRLFVNGEVTSTTRIPFFIFVFITGFGFIFLTAVLILKIVKTFRRNFS